MDHVQEGQPRADSELTHAKLKSYVDVEASGSAHAKLESHGVICVVGDVDRPAQKEIRAANTPVGRGDDLEGEGRRDVVRVGIVDHDKLFAGEAHGVPTGRTQQACRHCVAVGPSAPGRGLAGPREFSLDKVDPDLEGNAGPDGGRRRHPGSAEADDPGEGTSGSTHGRRLRTHEQAVASTENQGATEATGEKAASPRQCDRTNSREEIPVGEKSWKYIGN